MKINHLRYSLLSIPLAFVGLPIYINVTDFYIRNFDINIANIAFIILFVRLLDIFQEPILGIFCDYLIKKNIKRKTIIYFSSGFLALSFFALFNPIKNLTPNATLIWLAVTIFLTYSFFNLTIVCYESLAIIIAKDSIDRVSINSSKEFCGLIGILIASATPFIIKILFSNNVNEYLYLSLIFIIFLFLIIIFFFNKIEVEEPKIKDRFLILNIFKTIINNKIFVFLMLILFVNSLAVSIPASVISFYVNDILKMPKQLGVFLTIYFLSAGIFMLLWKKLAQKYGKINCWLISILGSIITFIFAYFINEQNSNLFYLICLFSGIFLGADLVMPPAIISEIIYKESSKISSYVALWNMINKFGLMLASFLALMILNFIGFDPQNLNEASLKTIPIIYAILPCLLKFIVILLLIKLKNLKIYEKNSFNIN